MKVGTISLNINTPDFNYGAVLHSWAFQQYLLKQDNIDDAEVIDYAMPVLEKYDRHKPFRSLMLQGRVKGATKQIMVHKSYMERLKKFDDFISKNLKVSSQHYIQKSLNSAQLPYDTIICESDVIWSPGFTGGVFDKSFFLALDSMLNMNRIAYAPSMSNGDLTKEQEMELCDFLKCVDHISCRESYEKRILEGYTDKTVTHVLDPVLLLSEDDYKPIIGDKLSDRKYILLYVPVDDNATLREHAKTYAQTHGLTILEISTKLHSKDVQGYKCLDTAGIEDFLSGIKYAECVFTNSFHAICFSVIFHTNFYAFSRSYAGKVKDICETLGLSEYYFPDDEFAEKVPIDYGFIDAKLLEMKEESEKWLNKAMQISGGGT